MNLFKQIKSVAFITAFLIAGSHASISGAKEILVLSSWLPPKHPIVTDAIKPWTREIAKATEGRVKIRVLAKPLGSVQAHYDLAVDGVADITYGVHSYAKDVRFIRSRFGQFSFLGETAAQSSKAYWDVYTQMLDAEEEHKNVKLLSLFVHGPGMFFNSQKPIQSTSDFNGLKVRTPGGYIASMMTELGATTQFMGPSEVFEKLSRGVIDGVTFPIEGVRAYKLTDHITHAMSLPGGLYNTSWFLVMNPKKWSKISVKDQKAILALSGANFAEKAGKVWDELDQLAWDAVNNSQIVVDQAPEAVVSAVMAIAQKHEKKWIGDVANDGHDGKAALEKFREIVAVD